MPLRIGCVVEGYAEVESVPVLIHRIAQDWNPGLVVVVPHPVRITKSKLLKSRTGASGPRRPIDKELSRHFGPARPLCGVFLKSGELERAAALAALNAGHTGGVLVILDSDDDCPAHLGPVLLTRVRAALVSRFGRVAAWTREVSR